MTAISASITSVFRNSRAPKMSQPSPSETRSRLDSNQYSPRAGEAEPESREDVGQARWATFQRAGDPPHHRLRGADPDLLFCLYAVQVLRMIGKTTPQTEREVGRKITQPEPQDEERRRKPIQDRIADADEREKKILTRRYGN